MGLHLTEIAKAIAPGAHALLIMDGAGWYGAKGLDVPDTITLPKLPPCAPELNPMENVWQYLKAHRTASGLAVEKGGGPARQAGPKAA